MQIDTKYFGRVSSDAGLVLDFPAGLPAFETERSFLAIEHPRLSPLIFLQSMTTASLCFLALPVLSIDPAYILHMSADELTAIGVNERPAPVIGQDVAALALITVAEDGRASANLMSPVVVSLPALRAIQAMRSDRAYSYNHPLGNLPALARQAEQPCL